MSSDNIMISYTEMTDQELQEAVHELALRVSYYNAAEGNWSREAAARGACMAEFATARNELAARGIEFVNQGYLL